MTESKSLRDSLEEKLQSGEISEDEYVALKQQLDKIGLLDHEEPDRIDQDKLSITGSKSIGGGKIKGPIKVAGSFISRGKVEAESLSVAGKASIQDDLVIAETAKIAGKMVVDGRVSIGENFKVAGKVEISEDLEVGEDLKISGKLNVNGHVLSQHDIKVSGKISCLSLTSKNLLKSDGALDIKEDVHALEFISEGGGNIGGSLYADEISVNSRNFSYIMNDDDIDLHIDDNIDFLELKSMINNIVKNIIGGFGTVKNPKPLIIEQNVEGKSISLSNTVVKGDVIGDIIKIGKNTKVEGTVRYRDTVEVEDEIEVKLEKIE